MCLLIHRIGAHCREADRHDDERCVFPTRDVLKIINRFIARTGRETAIHTQSFDSWMQRYTSMVENIDKNSNLGAVNSSELCGGGRHVAGTKLRPTKADYVTFRGWSFVAADPRPGFPSRPLNHFTRQRRVSRAQTRSALPSLERYPSSLFSPSACKPGFLILSKATTSREKMATTMDSYMLQDDGVRDCIRQAQEFLDPSTFS